MTPKEAHKKLAAVMKAIEACGVKTRVDHLMMTLGMARACMEASTIEELKKVNRALAETGSPFVEVVGREIVRRSAS